MLIAIGLFVGVFGTLIGAGGGFILVPVLMWLYPHKTAEQITAVSLAVVFCNALSGTITYVIKRKVDVRNGTLFALLSIPGALLGLWVNARLDRRVFDPLFALVLAAVALWIWLRPQAIRAESEPLTSTRRSIGGAASVAAGFLSSLLGIGGGLIHMPLLVFVLRYAVAPAVATSHFILAITSLVGTLGHAWNPDQLQLVIQLAPAAVIGAQGGAWLSSRVPAQAIAKAASVALIAVAARIALR